MPANIATVLLFDAGTDYTLFIVSRYREVLRVKALGAGAVLSSLSPKNLLLTIAAVSRISPTGITAGQQAVAYAVFMVIATIGVGALVVLYFALGTRSQQLLGDLKTWMARNNAAIMAVLLTCAEPS